MPGVKALRKIYLGKETTAGSATAAVRQWRGRGTIQDTREVGFANEDIGVLQRTNRSFIPRLGAKMTFDEIEATFEYLPYILEAGVKQVWTGATADSGSGKVYAYAFPTTQANTITTYTIEGGDDTQAEEMEYAFVKSFKLSGEGGKPMMITADWIGRQVSLCSFTTSITPPTVEEILFGKSVLYIDTAGSIGTTTKASTLLAYELNVSDTGIEPVWTGDSNALYFAFTKTTPANATLTMTFEHDSTSVAEKAAWRAETERALRLLTVGSALTTSTGTAHTTKKLIIDCYGKWESFDKIGEKNGNDIVVGKLRVSYSETASAMASITVILDGVANLT
jgi:hypothetical protein